MNMEAGTEYKPTSVHLKQVSGTGKQIVLCYTLEEIF